MVKNENVARAKNLKAREGVSDKEEWEKKKKEKIETLGKGVAAVPAASFQRGTDPLVMGPKETYR